MSKTIHLHKSLSETEISKLKSDILNSHGISSLISSDENHLLSLALSEKLDELNKVVNVVSRLGQKCNEPALLGFEHVFGDVLSGVIDVRELGFLVKDMDGMVKRMESYVNSTANLYNEMEVLNELEQAMLKKYNGSRRVFERKLIWQRQDVRHIKNVSLWNQTFDKVVELLARSVCTIFARILVVFGESALRKDGELWRVKCGFCGREVVVAPRPLKRGLSKSSSVGNVMEKKGLSLKHRGIDSGKGEFRLFRVEDFGFPFGTTPGRFLTHCLSLKCSVSRYGDDRDDDDNGSVGCDDGSSQSSGCCNVPLNGDERQSKYSVLNNAQYGPKSRLAVYASPSTVGGSAVALHYANVIIVIEKLLRYPHLVGEEARDDLYQMLPTSLRLSLRTNVKNLAALAQDWKQTLNRTLRWVGPLAHNMIRWQSERNFEQQQMVARTNVLLQTLYFADREKTEAAICELLVGLNYICRYKNQQEWQMKYGNPYID